MLPANAIRIQLAVTPAETQFSGLAKPVKYAVYYFSIDIFCSKLASMLEHIAIV